MSFELVSTHIRDLRLGDTTEVREGVLTVDAADLRGHLLAADARLASVEVHVARPGDSTRIVCVKDAIEPRVKVAGDRPGEGRRHALSGSAIVTCGRVVGFQEGLIDMTGPAAAVTPFAHHQLLVLELEPAGGLAPHEHEAALREAGVRAAERVGHAAAEAEPDRIERFTLPPCPESLPRVAYVYLVLSQGLLHDTWIEGRNAAEGLPRLVTPTFTLDDTVISGNCVSACDKNTTWHHQNNPVLLELLRHHGRDLNLAGVVLTNSPVRLHDKQAAADAAVAIARSLEVAGAIISKEGFGNPDADQMMLIRGLEAAGIATVAITDEFAGVNGASQSLADSAVEANAVVSTGNANELVELPAMDRVLGPADEVTTLAGASAESARADGSLLVELQTIVGATNGLGQGRLRAAGV
jgi:glycine reductase